MEMAGDEPGRDRRLRRRRLELRRPRRSRSCAACCAASTRSRFVAAEPAACPTLTRGVYAYDFGDTVGLTPLMPMYTLGHDFVPPPVHAGGLRYHGDAPMVCGLVQGGRRRGARLQAERDVRGRACSSPAPRASSRRPSRRTRSARSIEEAEAAKEAGEERTILFGLCGHGHFDLAAYDAYLAGTLEDPEFSEADMRGGAGRAAGGIPAIA